MDDSISRQAALNVIEREQFKGDAISEIEKLPPAHPWWKKGKWIKIIKDKPAVCSVDFQCSKCLKENPCYYLPAYCPNCGSRMEVK